MSKASLTDKETGPELSGLYLESINFNDGTDFNVEKNSIILITGANNCGKSQLLRDLCTVENDKIVSTKYKMLFHGDMKKAIADFVTARVHKVDPIFVSKYVDLWSGDVEELFEKIDKEDLPFAEALKMSLINFITTEKRIESITPMPDMMRHEIDRPFNRFMRAKR